MDYSVGDSVLYFDNIFYFKKATYFIYRTGSKLKLRNEGWIEKDDADICIKSDGRKRVLIICDIQLINLKYCRKILIEKKMFKKW